MPKAAARSAISRPISPSPMMPIVLPFDSPILARTDGVAYRADWQPTSLHRQFLDLLRAQAQDYQNADRAIIHPAPAPAL